MDVIGTKERPVYIVPCEISAGKAILMQVSENTLWIDVYYLQNGDYIWQFKFPAHLRFLLQGDFP